jgi:hypothetical protein
VRYPLLAPANAEERGEMGGSEAVRGVGGRRGEGRGHDPGATGWFPETELQKQYMITNPMNFDYATHGSVPSIGAGREERILDAAGCRASEQCPNPCNQQ